jgi:hypothetical protein
MGDTGEVDVAMQVLLHEQLHLADAPLQVRAGQPRAGAVRTEHDGTSLSRLPTEDYAGTDRRAWVLPVAAP